MKKEYQKPNLKSVQLLAKESLMSASQTLNITSTTAAGNEALSNQESELDLWGNKNSIW